MLGNRISGVPYDKKKFCRFNYFTVLALIHFDSKNKNKILILDQGMYQLGQQKESRLRDSQGNLLELSAYSGRNINVLDMMGS